MSLIKIAQKIRIFDKDSKRTVEIIHDEFVQVYDSDLTSDYDVENYFEELYIQGKFVGNSYNFESIEIYGEIIQYLIASHQTQKSLTRRLVYLNVFVDFLSNFYVTFLKDLSDRNVSIIIFDIKLDLDKKRSYGIKIKRRNFRDIDFYNN